MPEAVVNASVSVKWFNTSEPHSQQARALLRDFIDGLMDLHVPEIWFYEMAQAISRAINRNVLTEAEGIAAMTLIGNLGLNVHANPSWQIAFTFARQHGIQVYDALYVILAIKLECELWTADERLVRSVSSSFPFVHLIADYHL